MITSRREIREKALQTLFQLLANPALTKEEAMHHALALLNEDEEKVDKDEQEEGNTKQTVPPYLSELVSGVQAHEQELDALISKHLRNWSIQRLAKTDLLILRIAVYELVYQPDIPANIVINEAIEITKEYSDEESRKFVNGILSSVHQAQMKERS